MGLGVVVTREPGGSPRAPRRSATCSCRGRRKPLGPHAEALLFAAARDDHVASSSARRWRRGPGSSATASPIRPASTRGARQRRPARDPQRSSGSSSATRRPTSPSSSTCRPRSGSPAPRARARGEAPTASRPRRSIPRALREAFRGIAERRAERCVLIDADRRRRRSRSDLGAGRRRRLDPVGGGAGRSRPCTDARSRRAGPLEALSRTRASRRPSSATRGRAALLDAYRGGRLPHAWLIGGPPASARRRSPIAWRASCWRIGDRSRRRCRRASLAVDRAPGGAAGRGPGPSRPAGARAHRQRQRQGLRTVITVDEVRRDVSFFGSTAGAGGWRVCIVDSADDLNIQRRQRAPQGARGAAAALAVPAGEPRAGAAAADHPLALPPPRAAPARGATTLARACATLAGRLPTSRRRRGAARRRRQRGLARARACSTATRLELRERVIAAARSACRDRSEGAACARRRSRGAEEDRWLAFSTPCGWRLRRLRGRRPRPAEARLAPGGGVGEGRPGRARVESSISTAGRCPRVRRLRRRAQPRGPPACARDKGSAGTDGPAWPSASTSRPRSPIRTAPPHIGHAYEAIATDAIARFKRLDGYDVFFLTGTDEHGLKMQQTAAREGITPRELVERNVPRFRAMVERLNCSNDDFIRTTEERHHRLVQAIWERMEAERRHLPRQVFRLVLGARRGLLRRERETRSTTTATRRGPQGTPVEWVEEESYFFRLSAYQDKLLDLYEACPISCCRRSGATRWRAS